MDFIREQSGKQFDPEIVDHFEEILDQVVAIRDKYPDTGVTNTYLKYVN